MAIYKVRLSKRAALRMLNTEECNVIISKAHSSFVFTTEPGIFEHDGNQCVRIPKENIIVPVEDITKIEIPVSRFTPGVKSMMEVDWE